MQVDNRAFFERVLPFWHDISTEEQNIILGKTAERFYLKGNTIHGGGSDCAGLFIIKSGQLRVYILSKEGKEITLFRLFDRDVCILSSSCVMKDITFDVQIEAEKDSQLFLIPTAVYKKLADTNISVKDFTARIISSRLSDVMWIVEQVVFMSMDKRLAAFLVEQSSIEESDRLSITHEAIAKNLGTAREVITRMLKYFQNENMVSLSRGVITLTDRKKIYELLE